MNKNKVKEKTNKENKDKIIEESASAFADIIVKVVENKKSDNKDTDSNNSMIYYFAYGSNLDKKQIKERCPESRLIGKCVLKNYKLAFTTFSIKRKYGCADIIKYDNDEVWGLYYSLTENDLKKLDKSEGHPYIYKRFSVDIIDEFDKHIKAESYEVVNKAHEHQKPSKEYLDILKLTAEKYGFPDSYKQLLFSFEIQKS